MLNEQEMTGTVQIRATVTAILLTTIVLPKAIPLSDEPNYDSERAERSPGAFLVSSDRVFIDCTFDLPDLERILEGDVTLYVVGYVDSHRRFLGIRHRGGYGRVYDPPEAENNLRFIPDSAAYNYDLPRP